MFFVAVVANRGMVGLVFRYVEQGVRVFPWACHREAPLRCSDSAVAG